MTNAPKWILDAWAAELKNVLQFLTTEDWSVSASGDSASSPSTCYWWTQKFNLGPGATISIGAPPLAWSELGARILQAAGVDLIEQASARSTYLEAIQQSTNGLAQALGKQLSRNVEAAGGRDEPPEGAGVTFAVLVASGDFQLPRLLVRISEELLWAFGPAAPTAIVPQTREQPTVVEESRPPAFSSRNMSVLLDVQMPVSISFGKASMPLREIMKLTTGSAVELDRKPDDEVDVIVNNCVIARGEVVVVDGNYGVRITEIVSREQRLALRAGVRAC